MKLERLIRKHLDCGRREARAQLGAGLVSVNGRWEWEGSRLIEPFDHVGLGGKVLQARIPRYVALHKPFGHVSATVDAEHPTVIDLIDAPWATDLHLAGRLSRFTTGLVILTNDSRFSESLTRPAARVAKTYLVETDRALPPIGVAAFENGMRFEKERATTAPATLRFLGGHRCRLTIHEGKHHQVKRMFARFGVKVLQLHRESVGSIALGSIPPGAWRELSAGERGAAVPGSGRVDDEV